MGKKMWKQIGTAALAVALVLLSGVVVQAQQLSPGSGPESAMAPTVGWVTVAPGESHWYTFDYDYSDGLGDDDGEADTPKLAIATLEMAAPGSVGFEVQTWDRLGPWDDEDDIPGPLGVGSPLFVGTDDEGDTVEHARKLLWAGSARASGEYLIIVEGDGPYTLSVDGETVNFTAPALDNALAFNNMAPPAAAESAAMASGGDMGEEILTETFALTTGPVLSAGSAPESAMAPTIGWTEIDGESSHWYTFDYDYSDGLGDTNGSADAPEKATILLEMATPGSVEFEVQTWDRLGPWPFGVDDPGPVGVGSPLFKGIDDDHDGVYSTDKLVWVGGAPASENYLIVVNGSGAYRIAVDGLTVNFPEAAVNNAAAYSNHTPAAMPEAPVDTAMMEDEVQTESFALTAAPAVGSSLETASAPPTGWMAVSPGESHWYAFHYDADADEEDPSELATVLLEMVQPGSVGFEVQTMDRLGPWEYDDDIPGPLGVGSPLFRGTDDDGDGVSDARRLIWAGSSPASERYFVIVEGNGEYLLTVDGATVYFPESTLSPGTLLK